MGKKERKYNKYTGEFKLKVVEDYLSGKNGGYETLMKKYNMNSMWPIQQWVKKYKENPSLLFVENRGRKSLGRPPKIKFEEMTLAEQNQYLRMENDILKKLNALLEKYGER